MLHDPIAGANLLGKACQWCILDVKAKPSQPKVCVGRAAGVIGQAILGAAGGGESARLASTLVCRLHQTPDTRHLSQDSMGSLLVR